jgi:hypothetical protein
MKKLMLVASLCVVAAVIAPITSASAYTGTCKIYGHSTFKEEPLGLELRTSHYNFTSETELLGKSTKCIEAETGKEDAATATVGGIGKLACAVAKGAVNLVGETEVEGLGSITIGAKPPIPFKLSFVAAGGVVTLVIRKEAGETPPESTGSAEFLTPEPGTKKVVVEKCKEGTLGSLPFEAVVAGKLN